MVITKNLANYVKKKGVRLSTMSRATGIPYNSLYASLGSGVRKRPLSADEAVLICKFLGVQIECFAENSEKEG